MKIKDPLEIFVHSDQYPEIYTDKQSWNENLCLKFLSLLLFQWCERREEEVVYSHFIPKCCKTSNSCTCRVLECIRNLWSKFKESKWWSLSKEIEKLELTNKYWRQNIWLDINEQNGTRREWWLGLFGMLFVLLPKAMKFFAMDMFFPGYDVFTDCQAADEHFK